MNHRHKINRRSWRALLKAFLLMDLRNQQFGRVTNSKPADMFSAMFWIAGQNLMIGGFLSVVLFDRVESYVFALLAISASMIVVVTSIVVEFNEIVLDPDDLHVIGHRPVNVETYAAARLGNLFLYLGVVVLTVNLAPSIIGCGMRETTLWFFPFYWLATILGSFFVGGLLILFYTVGFAGRPGKGIQEVLAWTQAALIFVTFYGGQAVFRDTSSRLEMSLFHLPQWVKQTPPGWLSTFVVSSNSGIGSVIWWIPLTGMALAVVVWRIVLWRLTAWYEQLEPGRAIWQSELVKALPVPGQLYSAFHQRIGRNSTERLGLWLGTTMFRRDHNLRMRSWPALGFTLAFVFLGIVSGELENPLVGRGRGVLLTLAAIYSMALPIPTIFHNLRFSKDYEAAWVLRVAPIADRHSLAAGLRKAVIIKFMVPAALVLTGVLIFLWKDWLAGILHGLSVALVVLLTGYVCSFLQLRRLPFSEPAGRGESFGGIAPLMAAVSVAAGTLAAMHYAASVSQIGFAVYLIGLGALTWTARWCVTGRGLWVGESP